MVLRQPSCVQRYLSSATSVYDCSFQNAVVLQTTQALRQHLLRATLRASFDLIKAHWVRITAENPQYEDRPFVSHLIQEQPVEFDIM